VVCARNRTNARGARTGSARSQRIRASDTWLAASRTPRRQAPAAFVGAKGLDRFRTAHGLLLPALGSPCLRCDHVQPFRLRDGGRLNGSREGTSAAPVWPAHVALYDGFADSEVGHLLVELHTGASRARALTWSRSPSRSSRSRRWLACGRARRAARRPRARGQQPAGPSRCRHVDRGGGRPSPPLPGAFSRLGRPWRRSSVQRPASRAPGCETIATTRAPPLSTQRRLTTPEATATSTSVRSSTATSSPPARSLRCTSHARRPAPRGPW
jgi:hypothetical protein